MTPRPRRGRPPRTLTLTRRGFWAHGARAIPPDFTNKNTMKTSPNPTHENRNLSSQ